MRAVGLAICAAACGRVHFDRPAIAGDAADTSAIDAAVLDGAAIDAAIFDGAVIDAAVVDAAMLDFCTAIPMLPNGPVIDGVLDAGATLIAITPIWVGPGALPVGISARYAAAWRADRLYLFVDVTDPDRFPAPTGEHLFCGDAVELYADSDGVFSAGRLYDDPGASQLIVKAPGSTELSSASGEIWRSQVFRGAWSSSAFRAFPRPGGYIVEAAIAAPDLGLTAWSVSGHVGLDIGVDVSTSDGSPGTPQTACTGGGIRLGQFFLRISTAVPSCADSGPYCDARAFCSPSVI